LKVTLIDPCSRATINPVAVDNLKTSIKVGKPISTGDITAANSYGAVCGNYTFTYTSPQNLNFSSAESFVKASNSTGELTVQSEKEADIGLYSVVLSVALEMYPDVKFEAPPFTLEVQPCRVEKITMPDKRIEALSYTILQEALETTFPTFTQEPKCGYPLKY